jgi:quinol monooxygenase YgiN
MRPEAHAATEARAQVVMAEFEVAPTRFAEFVMLAQAFANECMAKEPGCLQFDVVELETALSAVLFFEAYASKAAFLAHCGSAHLARFQAAFKPLVLRERPLRHGVLHRV